MLSSALPVGAPRSSTLPGFGRTPRFDLLTAPFEALRFQYASAVAAGRLEQSIDRLERLILGPLARRR